MTAIKCFLFCYRLDCKQKSLKSLDYRQEILSNFAISNFLSKSTVNCANCTVNSAECTVNCAKATVNSAECTVNCAERTVNCAFDIVNRVMSYILYLSLRWSYEVGSCTIAISAMTAIKWYLFCYRLDFKQKSLNYTVANAQSTVPNAQWTVPNEHSNAPNLQLTVLWTLLTEWCLTSYTSVYDGRTKLGVVTLWSVWWKLSNDIYFVIEWILTRNR